MNKERLVHTAIREGDAAIPLRVNALFQNTRVASNAAYDLTLTSNEIALPSGYG